MTPEVAKEVHSHFDQTAIEAYVIDRINALHFALETAKEEVANIQGRIAELKLLLKAKDYARDVLEVKKKHG